MKQEQYLQNLTAPLGKVDLILDTDAYNEIDDQFAIAYMLKQKEKFNVKGICAAPFLNRRCSSPKDGMEKSYEEIKKLLTLAHREDLMPLVFRGSDKYLPKENSPVDSEAADFMAALAKEYSPEHPLYIVAIGAITNVASAILKNPDMKETCVVVWLGGHDIHFPKGASEFNMMQDIAAARLVFDCQIPLVQLPCCGVVDRFATSKYELEHWLKGKNPLSDYLCDNAIQEAESYAKDRPWTRVIWDVTAIAWLLNKEKAFMKSRWIPSPIPEYDKEYAFNGNRHWICYVYQVNRDRLFEDLFCVLAQ